MSYGPHESGCYRTDCSGRVCLSPEQHQEAWEKRTTFFCSRGHGQVFTEPQQTTYRQLKGQVDDLKRRLASSEKSAAQAWEWLDETRAALATCPFPDCPRGGYIYASQQTLIAHLDRWHGTDVGARISYALADLEDTTSTTAGR